MDLLTRRRRPRLPDELVAAVAERRAIPFVGAGFSSVLGLPSWDRLLEQLCAEIDPGLDYAHLRELTGGDHLQIAEYLYLRCDRRIGPLRHVIERGLRTTEDPARSAAHVELVNLGAPQVYTTNYDDLLESTYRALGLPCWVVALPKDVATVGREGTQIVKYHGDLRHESTLVLTESAYYRRLDFESPMDLKFRSDLLGRSVLYMGYSFRDINIRVIWFKLTQMTQDIPAGDRRPSFILRLTANPVLDELYSDVGLYPLVLDPDGSMEPADRAAALGDFLGELAVEAGPDGHVPGTDQPPFASGRLMSDLVERYGGDGREAGELPRVWEEFDFLGRTSPSVRFLGARVPPGLDPLAREAFLAVLRHLGSVPAASFGALAQKVSLFGPAPEITAWFCRLLRGGDELSHQLRPVALQEGLVPWDVVWAAPLSDGQVRGLLRDLRRQLDWHRAGHADDDLAYVVDVVARVADGHLPAGGSAAGSTEDGGAVVTEARALLTDVAATYPSVAAHHPAPGSAPDPREVLAEVRRRGAALEPASDAG